LESIGEAILAAVKAHTSHQLVVVSMLPAFNVFFSVFADRELNSFRGDVEFPSGEWKAYAASAQD
jgi:hypothetical protein